MQDHPFSGNQCTNSNEQDRNTSDDGDNERRFQRHRRDEYDFEHLSADGPTYLRQLQAREESRRSSGVPARGRTSREDDPHGAQDPQDHDGHDEAPAYRHRDGSFRRRRRPLARRRG